MIETPQAEDNVPSHDAWEDYQSRSYFPELDGLRAVSVITVVAHHMHDRYWVWLDGRLGVTTFFVLSGYLITMLALREEQSRGDLCLSAFYLRRSFRILPSYYLTLGVYCLTILVLRMRPEESRLALRGALPYYLFYFQELVFFRGIDGNFNVPFVQSWSLGIEEKFYLIWPILAFVLWRGDRGIRIAGTLVLTVVLAFAPALRSAGFELLSLLIAPYSRIMVGCLIALLLHDPAWFKRLSFLGRRGWTWATFLFLVGFQPWLLHLEALGHSIYAVVTGAFLIGLLTGGGMIRRALAWGPFVTIGRLSYGMYLLHYFGLNAAEKIAKPGSGRIEVAAVAFLLALAFTAGLAYVMARLVERPCIALGRRLSAKAIEAHAGHRARSDVTTGETST